MTQHINFARKLRPKSFNEVVGQDISVKMLCNGLALGRLFPTYIFSGGRGCGKTTTARIFAGALNCQNLTEILAQKTLNIPCNKCTSCKMMLAGNHPDFIEIDAASNTGVDNVRQVLEAATYLPLVGQKKIYLIDEAHMLSKSAFNALLKMLEEPPRSAVFMLATTELHKIPDTVRSRCFQALFKPVPFELVSKQLQSVAEKEKLNLHPDVFKVVAARCEGSLRDALNILEQISWACMNEPAEKHLVIAEEMLGVVDQEDIFALVKFVALAQPVDLMQKISTLNFSGKKPELLWQDISSALNIIFKLKLGSGVCFADKSLQEFVETLDLGRIKNMAMFFWQQESVFLKTMQKMLFLEHLLLQLANQDLTISTSGSGGASSGSKVPPRAQTKPDEEIKSAASQDFTPKKNPVSALPEAWLSFLSAPEVVKDKLLESILRQVTKIDNFEGKMILAVAGVNVFVQRKLDECREHILNALKQYFDGVTSLEFMAMADTLSPKIAKNSQISQQKMVQMASDRLPVDQANNIQNAAENLQIEGKAVQVDVSDAEKWPKSNLLTKLFGGKVESVP